MGDSSRTDASPVTLLDPAQDAAQKSADRVAIAATTVSDSRQQWFEAILNLMPTPLLLIEPGTARVLFANKAADQLAGGEFPKGKPAEEYHTLYYCTDASGSRIPDEQMPGVRAARGERLQNFQMDWHTHAGTRSLIVQSETLPALHGHPETVVLSFQDVTALKRSEQLSNRLGKILDESSNEIYIFDAQTLRFVQANQGARTNLGYTLDELTRLTPIDVSPEFTADQFAELIAPLCSKTKSFLVLETTHRRKDGSVYPVEARLQLADTEDPPVFMATVQDITQRKQSEAELRQSEAQLRLITDSLPVLVSYVDRDLRYRFNNPAYEEWFGEDRESIYGKTLPEVLGDAAFESVRAHMEAALAGQQLSFEAFMPYKTGGTRHIHATYVPDVRADGEVAGVVALVRDISERKQIEDALRESEARFRTMADSAPVLMWMAGTDAGCYFFNQPWLNFTGRTLDEEMGSGWTEGVHPEDRDHCLQTYLTAFESRESFEIEYRLRRADGEYRWLLDKAIPRFIPDGGFAGFIGSCIDITERKQAEAALVASEQRARAVADAMPLVVWTSKHNEDPDYYNQYWFDYTGLTLEQCKDKGWQIALHPDDRQHNLKDWYAAIQTGELYEIEYRLRRFDGMYRWHLGRATPVRDSSDRIMYWVGTGTDIDDQKRAAEEQRFLAQAGTLLASSLDIATTLTILAGLAVPQLGDWCAIYMTESDGAVRQVEVVHEDPAMVELACELQERYPHSPNAPHGPSHVIRTGQPEIMNTITPDTLTGLAQNDEHLSLLQRLTLTSVMSLPLQARGRTIGALVLGRSATQGGFGENEQALAEELARRAMMAMDNARLFAQAQEAQQTAQRAADRTAQLLAITAAFSVVMTPEQVAQVAIKEITSGLGARAAFIAMLTSNNTELETINVEDYPPALAETWRLFPVTASVPLAEVVRTGKPIWLEPMETRITRYPHLATEYTESAQSNHSAWASIPLLVDGRPVGGMSLSFPAARQLSDDERNFILAVAGQCALAMERARLYEAEQTARLAAEKAARRTERLQEVTAALAEALTAQQVTDVVVSQGIIALEASAGSVVLLTPDGTELEMLRSSGYSSEIQQVYRRFPLDTTLPLPDAIRTGKPIWLESLAAQFAHYPALEHVTQRTSSNAIAALPLSVEGRVMGALGLSFATQRTFSEEERTFMLALAAQCAQALARARLYEAERQARAAAEAAERVKEESLALLDTLFATAPVGLGFFDRDLRYARVNQALATINGMSSEAHIGRQLKDVLPNMSDAVLEAFQHVIGTGEPIIDQEVIGETPALPGKRRYWLGSYYPVRAANGEVLGLGAVVAEVTEQRRAEKRQRFLVEASTILASSLDYEETLRSVARLVVPGLADWCAIDMLGEDGSLRRLEVAHMDPEKVALAHEFHRRYPPDLTAPSGLAQVLRTGKANIAPEITEEMLVAAIREPERLAMVRQLGIKSSMMVPMVAGGRTLGAILLFAAESNRRYDQDDLALAESLAHRAALAVEHARLYREAQEAILARDDFLSIASHELKTPLTSLQLQVQALLRSAQKGRLSEMSADKLLSKLTLLDQQADRLTRLANDLLDVARIRAGRVEFRLEEFDVAEVVRDVVARFDEQAALAECPLLVHADAPAVAWSDRSRLDQVITNLLSNAIKYGPGKAIDIIVENSADAVRITVRDQGIGIAPEHLERIFVRFERAVSSRNYGGLGLGLYIVRQLVEALGGSIHVTSELGAGATFVVVLPHIHAPR